MAKKTKRGRGHPPTVTEEVRKQFVEILRLGNYRSVAAKSCGVTLQSINRFINKKAKEGGQFRDEIEKAEADAEVSVVKKLVAKAKAGDIKAIEFFLARKYTERWGNNAEILREMNKVIARLEQRLKRGDDVDNPHGGKPTKQ